MIEDPAVALLPRDLEGSPLIAHIERWLRNTGLAGDNCAKFARSSPGIDELVFNTPWTEYRCRLEIALTRTHSDQVTLLRVVESFASYNEEAASAVAQVVAMQRELLPGQFVLQNSPPALKVVLFFLGDIAPFREEGIDRLMALLLPELQIAKHALLSLPGVEPYLPVATS